MRFLRVFFVFVLGLFIVSPSQAQPLAPSSADLRLIGLYPTGKLIPAGKDAPWIFYIYESDSIQRLPGETVSFYPKTLKLKNWDAMWFVFDDKGMSEYLEFDYRQGTALPSTFRLRCYLRYIGPFQEERRVVWNPENNLSYTVKYCLLSEKQLDACRPEVLLMPSSGITPASEKPDTSLLSRVLRREQPERVIRSATEPVNVLMLLIDTLRADHTSPGGHPFAISPHIDMLASLGTFFSRSYGASSSTRPSVGSIFTGLQPRAHGALRHATNGAALLSGIPRLAESFQGAGFHTVGISANAQITDNFGFHRGFDTYECPVWESSVTPHGLDWLRTLDEPFFLYLHYMAPHQPYEPPEVYASLYRGKSAHKEEDLYCGEITLEDRRIGEILRELSRQGILNNTLIWLLSDHGEEFWEHGWNGHGAKVFEESVRTLSIVLDPQRVMTGARVEVPVTQADVFPTLAEIFEWEVDTPFQGRSLLPLLSQTDASSWLPRPIFLHHGGGSSNAPHESDKAAILQANQKLIFWPEQGKYEMFDLMNDAGEKNDIIATPLSNLSTLKTQLHDHLQQCDDIAEHFSQPSDLLETSPLSNAELENLRNGQYID